MKTRARIHGEPLNPIFALLPVAMLGLAVLSDMAAGLSGLSMLHTAAFWDLGAALVASLPAAGVALVDVLAVPSWSRARTVVLRYGLTTTGLTVLILFLWAARLGGEHRAGLALTILELIALGVGVAGAWRARELVVGHDVPDREPPPPPRIFPRPPSPSELATVRLPVARRPVARVDGNRSRS
jgi:uncharacterized membrane protein